MDRLLVDFSMEGSGPLTRSLDHASTSGFIRDDAPHWAIEPFIPIQFSTLVDYLVGRGELDQGEEEAFCQFCREFDKILQERRGSYHTRFSDAYASIDPDSDTRNPRSLVSQSVPSSLGSVVEETGPQVSSLRNAASANVADLISLLEEILEQAGYRPLSRADIEQCVGVASQWGVSLNVDFDLFEQLIVFARGDIIGTRIRRRLRSLYRRETVDVPIHQRMVVVFRLRDDDQSDEKLTASALHLRMFKNIPKQDVDMLLPGTRVRISGIDHFKIILPSLGGLLMSLRRIAQYALLFAVIALHWTAILTGIVLGYLVKSVLSYFQTKKRYKLNLTRNLYFQKLDTNAGVGYRIIQQAHRQSVVEMVLAYYAIRSNGEPISTRRLRRRCERIIREAVDVEVDFQVKSALHRLVEMKAVTPEGDHWKARV